MISQQNILHFRTFGYVVARNLLSDAEVAQLSAEVTAALTDAYGGVGTDLDPDAAGGIRGDYLPLAADRAPFSQALIADDPRFYQGSVALTGGPTVPTAPIATCFTSNAGWHNDDGTEISGVKFLIHLQPPGGDTGALRVMPGSHDGALRRSIEQYFRQDPARQGFSGWPAPFTALETSPGDVIAFDLHLFHSSAGGCNRLAWTIEYLPCPGSAIPPAWPPSVPASSTSSTTTMRHTTATAGPPGGTGRRKLGTFPRGNPRSRLRLLGVLGDGDSR